MIVCHVCGQFSVTSSYRTSTFEYNDRGSMVRLKYFATVYECSECSLSYEDSEASDAKNCAVIMYHSRGKAKKRTEFVVDQSNLMTAYREHVIDVGPRYKKKELNV